MKKRKLKPVVIPLIYTISIGLFAFGLYFIEDSISNNLLDDNDELDNTKYVSDEIVNDNDYIPVISESPTFIRPYSDDNVKLVKGFYDYKANSEEQEQSIVVYENIYMQNSGVDYSSSEAFVVLSSISGTVSEVTDDKLLGKCVTIIDTNNIKVVYSSLGDVSVKEGDSVSIGQSIANSGVSNINNDLGNHLHFELYVNDNVLNPENYYDKSLNDILEG